MIDPLSEIHLEYEADVFAARQRARLTAEALGYEINDQVRFATAISELARSVLSAKSTARVVFGIAPPSPRTLIIETTIVPPIDLFEDALAGADAGRRLLDEFSVEDGPPQVITMAKLASSANAAMTPAELTQLRRRIAAAIPLTPLDELRAQNLDLLFTLEQLSARQEELIRLNNELTETNNGVLAMYQELSQELESTNRGVVALYGELDDRGLQLRAANEAKSRFLTSVSHELRSPLNAVIGIAHLLLDPLSEPLSAEQTREVELIERSTREVLALVNDLLDLAAAEAGRLVPVPQAVDLRRLCLDLQATMQTLAGAEVEFSIAVEDAPEIDTDPKLLLQVLRNLVSNALKYTEEGFVRLRVETSNSSKRVRVVVEDSGIGIAPEWQQRVFEEFFQIPGGLQARHKGTGLGLAHARRLVEVLGGEIELHSAPGQGTTVTISLPIRAMSPAGVVAHKPAEAPTIRLNTVLVADDEEPFRIMLREMLQGSAERVLEARDGEAALEAMRRYQPDLVLLDLKMPGGGGEMVLARARTEDRLRDLPIILVTSVETTSEVLQGFSPSLSVVSKSDLSRTILLEAINEVLPGVRP